MTGAGGGIGRGVSLALARAGASVAALDIDGERAGETAGAIEAVDGRALVVTCDVADRGGYERALADAADAFGGIDILVQAAQGFGSAREPALTPVLTPLEKMPVEHLDFAIATGVRACFFGCQGVFPYLRARGGGRIVNFAAGWGLEGYPGAVDYNCTKEAIRGLTRTAAREWGRYGITVNAVCPAARTPALEAWQRTNPDQYEQRLASISVGRYGDAEKDVGGTIVFLASSASDMITGTTLMVDGGLVNHP